jgi:hypothetical protein
MCLYINKEKTDKFLNKKEKFIWVYKTIRSTNQPIFFNGNIKQGWYISNRRSKNLNNDERKNHEIYQGIHVYLVERQNRYLGYKMIKCKAYLNDLVKVGRFDQAVFMKVWIPKGQL